MASVDVCAVVLDSHQHNNTNETKENNTSVKRPSNDNGGHRVFLVSEGRHESAVHGMAWQDREHAGGRATQQAECRQEASKQPGAAEFYLRVRARRKCWCGGWRPTGEAGWEWVRARRFFRER